MASPDPETEDDVCAICLNSVPEMALYEQKKLDCAHVFHSYCLRQWFSAKQTCPLCVQVVKTWPFTDLPRPIIRDEYDPDEPEDDPDEIDDPEDNSDSDPDVVSGDLSLFSSDSEESHDEAISRKDRHDAEFKRDQIIQTAATVAEISHRLINNDQTLGTISDIHFHGVQIGDTLGARLVRSLAHNSRLNCFSMRNHHLSNTTANLMGTVLMGHKGLRTLDLSDNNITADGVKRLGFALGSNARLTHLYLNGLEIGDIGAHYLAKGLLLNKVLAVLSMCAARIENKGAEKLAEMLKVNKCLRLIDLSGNERITATGAAALRTAVMERGVACVVRLGRGDF